MVKRNLLLHTNTSITILQGVQPTTQTHGKPSGLTFPHTIRISVSDRMSEQFRQWPPSPLTHILTPDGQIIEYSLEFLSINFRYWSPDDFLNFTLCTWIAFITCWFYSFPTCKSHGVRSGEKRYATKENQFFGPHTRSVRQPMNCMLYGQLKHTTGIDNRPAQQHTKFSKK